MFIPHEMIDFIPFANSVALSFSKQQRRRVPKQATAKSSQPSNIIQEQQQQQQPESEPQPQRSRRLGTIFESATDTNVTPANFELAQQQSGAQAPTDSLDAGAVSNVDE